MLSILPQTLNVYTDPFLTDRGISQQIFNDVDTIALRCHIFIIITLTKSNVNKQKLVTIISKTRSIQKRKGVYNKADI